jgi:hypothetical protein
MGHCVHFYYRFCRRPCLLRGEHYMCVVAAEMRIKIVSNDFSRFDRIYIYGGGRVGTSKSSRLMQ